MRTINKNKVLYTSGFVKQELQPEIYSNEEREVGVWIDGKPLYQKTWLFDNLVVLAHDAWTNTPIRCSDYSFGSIVNVVAHLTTTGATFLFIAADPDSKYLNIFSTRNVDFSIDSLTIKYTKTTDTAGSGIWTTTGVPAVHYDGNEKVIGTWFGETLYEKTIKLENQQIVIGSNTFNLNISNMSTVVKADVVMSNSSKTNYRVLNADDFGINEKLFYKIETTGQIVVIADTLCSSPNIYITVCYTKTTD